MSVSITSTIHFIKEAHSGQKYGEKDFFHHPLTIMQSLPSEAPEDVLLAALLHDVLEDTPYTETNLREMGYSEYTISLVKQLTRPEGENRPSYMQWIKELAESNDIWLIRIKRLDNMFNLIGRPEMISRYSRSLNRLLNAERRLFKKIDEGKVTSV